MRPALPFLFPKPRAVVRQGGVFDLKKMTPAVLRIECKNWEKFNNAATAFLEKSGGAIRLEKNDTDGAVIGEIRDGAPLPPDGYILEISEKKIAINAADARGAFYAVQTLSQFLKNAANADENGGGVIIPCATITDYPDLKTRGFMLDISRCKVPTLDTLFELVPQLSALRINQFQLYIEHTFAFPAHEIVWRDASPMTPAEMKKLDERCHSHGIELVPNLQSFGHMDRWLKHAEYRHLAECPDGFFYDLTQSHRDAGTLKPNRESLDFVAQLYDAYLPNFSSDKFNIGGDEPWELGMGWSADLCASRGRHAVYCEHLFGLEKLVEKWHRRMQFWADILLEAPENAELFSRSSVPIIWGYDAGHPFATQCATLQKSHFDYLVAPGVSSWQTFHGRLDNALANVNEAVRAAVSFDADGVLITSWGDNGNHNPWFVFYPALAAGAAQSWCLAANAGADLARGIGAIFLENDTALAQAILDFGTLDRCFKKQIRNKSLLWEILCSPKKNLLELLPSVSLDELENAEKFNGKFQEISSEKNPLVADEMALASRMNALAIRRAKILKTGVFDEKTTASFQEILSGAIREFRRVWLLRARIGGLDESVEKLKKISDHEFHE